MYFFSFQSKQPQIASQDLMISKYQAHQKDIDDITVSLQKLNLENCTWTFLNVDIVIANIQSPLQTLHLKSTDNKRKNTANITDSVLGTVLFERFRDVQISRCNFEGHDRINSTIFNFANTTGKITQSNFTGNIISSSEAGRYGRSQGAALIIVRDESDITIKTSKFFSNEVINGTISVYQESTLFVEGSIFDNNHADHSGGSIYAKDRSAVKIESTNFTRNIAKRFGGAVYASNKCTVDIDMKSIYHLNTAKHEDGGAISAFGSTSVSIYNSTFTNNRAEIGRGGALNADLGCSVFLSNVFFKNNSAFDSSGAIQCFYDCNLSAEHCQFQNHRSNDGGAISTRTRSAMNFNNCTFFNNTALMTNTGAIVVADRVNLTVQDSTFSKNSGAHYAGAILAYSKCSVNIRSTNFTSNLAHFGAGCIYAEKDVLLEFQSCHFVDNIAYRSGGVMIGGPSVQVNTDNCHFINNTALTGFGGVFDGFGLVNITGSHFTSNRAGYRGGFLGKNDNAAKSDTIINIEDSTVVNNSASQDGGALFCLRCVLTSVNTIWVANVAKSDGGALYLMTETNVTIINDTFDANVAQYGDGGAIILKDNSKLDTNGPVFINNTAENAGGAINIWSSPGVGIHNTRFLGNRANFMAGAIIIHSGVLLSAYQSVFAENNARAMGGALKLQEGGEVCCEHCAFLNNQAGQGGAIYVKASELKLARTDLIENQARKGESVYIFASEDKPPPSIKLFDSVFSNGIVFVNSSQSSFEEVVVELNLFRSEPNPTMDIKETPYASGNVNIIFIVYM